MTLSVRQYEELRDRAADSKALAERAAGARAQLLKQLKEKFGCDSLKEAKRLLKKKREELEAQEEKVKSLVEKFNDEYGKKLGAIE